MPREYCVRVQGRIRHVVLSAPHPLADDVLNELAAKWPALLPRGVAPKRLCLSYDDTIFARHASVENIPCVGSVLDVVVGGDDGPVEAELDAARAECDALRAEHNAMLAYMNGLHIPEGIGLLTKIKDDITSLADGLKTSASGEDNNNNSYTIECQVRDARTSINGRVAEFHASTSRHATLVEERRSLTQEIAFLERIVTDLEARGTSTTETVLTEAYCPAVDEAIGTAEAAISDALRRQRYMANAPRVACVGVDSVRALLEETAYAPRDRVLTAELANLFLRMSLFLKFKK